MKQIIISLAALCCTVTALAQTDRTDALVTSERNGWEFEVRAGLNIGGASPLPLPVEIRKINSYSPKLNGALEGTVTKWLGERQQWGVSAGLKVEEKGMQTGATVKNYSMEIIDEGSHVAGYWTGYVKTDYNTTLLTLPVMANYRLGNRWKVRAGLFGSLKLDGDFSGYVRDGYLREGTPVGEKVSFTDGKTASYDFSSSLRHFQWGAQMGATWRAFSHFTVNADLTWAFNDIFESSFKTVTFNLYPIYLNLGFGYRF
ncbi:MAG: PorT family protein [Prevotella sp.]|nr:PorT family protein [Prevotella sp.]